MQPFKAAELQACPPPHQALWQQLSLLKCLALGGEGWEQLPGMEGAGQAEIKALCL